MLPVDGYGLKLATIEIVLVLQNLVLDDKRRQKRTFCEERSKNSRIAGRYDENTRYQ